MPEVPVLLRSESFVTEMVPKRPRLRLGPHWYKELCRQVLARDNWRCQVCGSSNNLQVHHRQLRSQQGSDEDSNLITLCAECHAQLHGSRSENHRLWE
jgi:5-methylcytosine-specific restriction endonuclease McrA